MIRIRSDLSIHVHLEMTYNYIWVLIYRKWSQGDGWGQTLVDQPWYNTVSISIRSRDYQLPSNLSLKAQINILL